MLIVTKTNIKKLIFAVLIAVAAGFTNGFLGAGGGILLLFGLSRLEPCRSDESVRDGFASCVFAVLLLSCVSAVTYSHKADLDLDLLGDLAVPGALGGIVGAFLTDKLNTTLLRAVFSLLMLIAGINMIF